MLQHTAQEGSFKATKTKCDIQIRSGHEIPPKKHDSQIWDSVLFGIKEQSYTRLHTGRYRCSRNGQKNIECRGRSLTKKIIWKFGKQEQPETKRSTEAGQMQTSSLVRSGDENDLSRMFKLSVAAFCEVTAGAQR